MRPTNFYSGVDNNGNVMEQLRWFKPDGQQADSAYFGNVSNHAIAWRIDGSYTGIMGLPLFETARLLQRARVQMDL